MVKVVASERNNSISNVYRNSSYGWPIHNESHYRIFSLDGVQAL